MTGAASTPDDLLAIFDAALGPVRGDAAVARQWRATGLPGSGPVAVFAAGKAALAMLRGVADPSRLGRRRCQTLVVTKERDGWIPEGTECLLSGHPVPDPRSEHAARRWLEELGAVPRDCDVLVLLSGGASALLGSPAEGLSRQDLEDTTRTLLRAGADIEALNVVRKRLGRVGGGLSLAATGGARVEVWVLSDVAGDRLPLIASGPFCADPHRFEDALSVLRRLGVWEELPAAVRGHLEAGERGERPEGLHEGDPALARVRHHIVANLEDALRAAGAAARERGFEVRRWPRAIDGEAREEARAFALAAREAAPGVCWIAGGEPVVTVRGGGLGGRCQEFALAAALALEGHPGVAVLAAGTDGSDGPTDAAGALADGDTLSRGRAAGRDPQQDLAENDSHHFFREEGGLIRTGPTGSNVNDLFFAGTSKRSR